jgi:hypothetical protein
MDQIELCTLCQTPTDSENLRGETVRKNVAFYSHSAAIGSQSACARNECLTGMTARITEIALPVPVNTSAQRQGEIGSAFRACAREGNPAYYFLNAERGQPARMTNARRQSYLSVSRLKPKSSCRSRSFSRNCFSPREM